MLSVRAHLTVRLGPTYRLRLPSPTGWRLFVMASLFALSLFVGAAHAQLVDDPPALDWEPRCLGETPLHVAVASKDVREVARLVVASPAMRVAANALGETPLHMAARDGTVGIVRLLLTGVGNELEMSDAAGATPLLRALAMGREPAARLLLGAGASVDARTNDGLTALHMAARRGLAGLIPTLARAVSAGTVSTETRWVELAAALAKADEVGLTPIEHAALSGSRPTVQALLSLGALPSEDTLVVGCGLQRSGLVAWLAQKMRRGPVRLEPSRLGPPLERALEIAAIGLEPVSQIELATVSCLLDAGATVSTAAFRGALAAHRPDLGALLVLRSLGHFGEERGDPFLHIAAAAGERGLVAILVLFGARIDAVDAEGATALHRAILANNSDGLRALLAAGDDGQATFRGFGPIGLALHEGAIAALQVLGDRLGLDARSAVALGKVTELAAILQRDRAAASGVGDDGLTPLQVAARFGAFEAGKVLVAAGAPLDDWVGEGVQIGERDVSGWTALHFAAWQGHAAFFHWLLAAGATDSVAGDGESARAKAKFPISVVGSIGQGVNSSDGNGLQGWGFGGQPTYNSRPPLVRPSLEDDPTFESRGEMGLGAAMPASYTGLGGGLLRDERRLDQEVIPANTLVGVRNVDAVAPILLPVLRQCIVGRQWFEAERVARMVVSELELAPVPETLLGVGWNGQRLLAASAQQSLARVLTETRRFAEADRAFATALERLAPITSSPAVVVQILPVHRLWAAIAEGRSRLHMRMGLFDVAEADVRAGMSRLAADALAALRAGLVGKLAIVLGEAAHYGLAIDAARDALRLTRMASRSPEAPSPHTLRQNLATLLARAGERVEARELALAELERVKRGEVFGAEDTAMIRYSAGLWRLLDGAVDEGEALVVEAREGLAAVSPKHPALGRFDLGLGLALTGMQRLDEAMVVLQRGQSALLASEFAIDLEALSPASAIDFARILVARAAVERLAGRADAALELARNAYSVVVGAQALEARWQVELELARIEVARGQLAVAIFFGKRAVKTLNRIRAAGIPAALAKAFVDDRLAAWRELADHLVQAGRFLEATAALGALKDDEAEGLATRGKGSGDGAAGAVRDKATPEPQTAAMPEVGAEKQNERPEQPLKAAQRESDKLAEVVQGGSPNAPANARLDEARKVLRDRRRAFEAWLQALEGELDAMPPARAQAIAAMNLRDLASLQETLGSLGKGVVMVHYLITDDRVRAIVTTSDSQVGREAPIKQADLNALVFQFRQVLVDPSRDAKAAAHALYDVLIAPIEQDLADAGAQTLLVSLDGTLRYAPLAALWDGKQWLVERFRIVHFARSALHSIMATRPSQESLAAFGCGRAVPGFQELTAVPAELESIVKRDDADPDGELPGIVRLDDAFSRESLTTLLEEKRYSAIHIASHFVLGAGGESESYLLLGDGQKLTLEDIRYDMRFDGVDLLSLSACNTAVGDKGSDGREIEGFASLALRLGARAVLATLWPVSDASTGLFMRTVYRLIKADPTRSRAEVLRLAMLAFIHREVALPATPVDSGGRGTRPLSLTANNVAGFAAGAATAAVDTAAGAVATIAKAIDLSHPRYWAPFVFIGNWR